MATVPEYFGSMVFDDRVMKARLSEPVYRSLKRTIDQGARLEMEAASVGGGNIDITSLGGMNVDFSGKENTLIIRHRDTPGMIALVSGVLAGRQMNIATMQVFRRDAGAEAIMVLELDTPLTPDLLAELRGLHDVMDATFLARRDD